MSRVFNCVSLVIIVVIIASLTPARAASNQPFFQGYWRCNSGQTLSVTPSLGPWLSYHSTQGSNRAQAYWYKDPSGGGWVNVGVDSSGGYWTMTSSGWQGNQLTFSGTYTNYSKANSQRQVITQNSPTAMTVQTWRNGTMIGQIGCNK